MGLDMYLNGTRYLSPFSNDDRERAEEIQKLFPELKGKETRFGSGSIVKTVNVEVGYWRKANAIHKWFVDNVQDGEDDCRRYYVSHDRLKELRSLCEKVLEDISEAPNLLPSESGFFFGSTDYDEYYRADLITTLEIIESALSLPDTWDFEYHSSW